MIYLCGQSFIVDLLLKLLVFFIGDYRFDTGCFFYLFFIGIWQIPFVLILFFNFFFLVELV